MNYHDEARKLLSFSNCLRRQYACVIVKDGVVISQGYNYSLEHCSKCERENAEHNQGDYADCHSIHAEQMAMLRARGHLLGAKLYLACNQDDDPEPCPICQRMMNYAGIVLARRKKCNEFLEQSLRQENQETSSVH